MSEGIRPVEAVVPHRVKRLAKEKREEKDDGCTQRGFRRSFSEMAHGGGGEGERPEQPVPAAPEPDGDERQDEDEADDDSAVVGRNLDVRT